MIKPVPRLWSKIILVSVTIENTMGNDCFCKLILALPTGCATSYKQTSNKVREGDYEKQTEFSALMIGSEG
jgi:hypothetical protein